MVNILPYLPAQESTYIDEAPAGYLKSTVLPDIQWLLFNNNPTLPSPLIEGLTYWDAIDKTLSTVLDVVNNVILQHGQELHVRCMNVTGATIPNGSVVYINGVQTNRPTIALADASDYSKCRSVGIAIQDILNNAEGFCTRFGVVRGIDTHTFTSAAPLYLSATTPGAMTTTCPTSPNFVCQLGVTLNSTADGSIYFRPFQTLGADNTLGAPGTDTLPPSQLAMKTALAAKESTISAGTSGQYWRGDKSWQTLNASAISDASTAGQNLVKLANPSAVTFLRINSDNTVTTLNSSDFMIAIGAAATSHTQGVNTISDASTAGQNLVKLSNPSAVTFIRINANNTVSSLIASDFLIAIGATSTTHTHTSLYSYGSNESNIANNATGGTCYICYRGATDTITTYRFCDGKSTNNLADMVGLNFIGKHKSSDNTAGYTGTITIGTNTITVKDGLITAWT